VPYVQVNGARLFYRRLGELSSEPPVILIHGATVDGKTDWGAIAPVLGLRREVILPDCRGHGRSANPAGSYRFQQLADDVASLVRVLGHDTAHIVGHSNGGNVALVTLVEHPDVVATCVIQAGNAFVSADLIEKEPANFDPDRVARDDPGWRDQIVRLHGRWHGAEYWRQLLAITVAEIVAAPSYSPADLESVDRPTLVIEGQQDRVNARSHHGEFLARHIPDAELWRPADVGHSVHQERPAEWLAQVEEFWRRRGTPARNRIWALGRRVAADRRATVFEIEVAEEHPGEEVATGLVLAREQEDDIRRAIEGTSIKARLRVLEDEAEPGVVVTGVADVLDGPCNSAARLTQALFGEQLALLDRCGDFTRVRLARDGYVGWVKTDAATAATGWPGRATYRIWSDDALAYSSPGGEVVGRLPFGSPVLAACERGGWLGVPLGKESLLWVCRRDTRPADEGVSVDQVLARFRRFVGVPYLWGGRTPWGFDCSGMAQAFLAELGPVIPRDTDQQWQAGIPIESEPAPGDLVFFGDPGSEQPERVAHVGIALNTSSILHAWGGSGSVTITTWRGGSDGPAGRLRSAFLGVRRFLQVARAA
jgi:pimeloyl-ACP methyl ester carboxylesterase